jgi:hypothetical protein
MQTNMNVLEKKDLGNRINEAYNRYIKSPTWFWFAECFTLTEQGIHFYSDE